MIVPALTFLWEKESASEEEEIETVSVSAWLKCSFLFGGGEGGGAAAERAQHLKIINCK
jgi:hypothetical protein